MGAVSLVTAIHRERKREIADLQRGGDRASRLGLMEYIRQL